MNVNFFDRMEFLKDTTRLSPVEYALVLKARKKKEDHPSADEIEYAFRLRRYAYIIEPLWHEYTKIEHDSFGLLEFAEMLLNNYIEKEKSKVRKK